MSSKDLMNITNSERKIQLLRIAHVYQKHPNLQKWAKFAKDFGFVEAHRQGPNVYFRGYGKDPYCIVASQSKTGKREYNGTAFLAKTQEDFEKAKRMPGAYVTDISKAPGGGMMVSIPTPTNNLIHVVWGQTDRAEPRSPPSSQKLTYNDMNTSLDKARKGEFQRLKAGPALVHKLGHYGFLSKKFDEDVRFYTSNFNFIPSDLLHNPKKPSEVVASFFHLDHGEEWSDHHSLFLIRAPWIFPETRMHHTSYEVDDFDTQVMGHEWLLSKRHKLIWGVGRHILGSQIFDYWKDPSGFVIEHYADGDLVNSSHKVTCEPDGGPMSLAIWGPAYNEIRFSGLNTRDILGIVLWFVKWPVYAAALFAAVAMPFASGRALVFRLLASANKGTGNLYANVLRNFWLTSAVRKSIKSA